MDSVGVNTHLRHARSFYDRDFELLKQRLLAARIRHIRDGAMDQDGRFFRAIARSVSGSSVRRASVSHSSFGPWSRGNSSRLSRARASGVRRL